MEPTISKEVLIKTMCSRFNMNRGNANTRINYWVKNHKITYERGKNNVPYFPLVTAQALMDDYRPRKTKKQKQQLLKDLETYRPPVKFNDLIKPIAWKWIDAHAKTTGKPQAEIMANIINKTVLDRLIEQAQRAVICLS